MAKRKPKTNAQLRAEVAKLKKSRAAAEARIKLQMAQRRETLKLKRELTALKNPGSLEFRKNVRSGLRRGGKATAKGIARGSRGLFRAALLIGEDVDKAARARLAHKRAVELKSRKRK